MKKEFSQDDAVHILKNDTEIPETVEKRIQDTYAALGLTENTAGQENTGHGDVQSQKTLIVHRKKRKAWAAVAAAAALTAGLSVTAFAVNQLLHAQVDTDENGQLVYGVSVDPSAGEAHEVSVRPTYLPDGYTYQEDGLYTGKYHNDETGGGITIAAYNAAELYEMSETGNYMLAPFNEDEKTDTLTIQGMTVEVFDRGSDYVNSNDHHYTLLMANNEDGYLIEIYGMAEELTLDEMTKVAEGLDIEVLDSTVPYPTEEELARIRQEQQDAQEAAQAAATITDSSICKTGDIVKDASTLKDWIKEGMNSNFQYQVEDIRIVDSLPAEDFPKENFSVDYDTLIAPLLDSDGILKAHERYASADSSYEGETEMADASFIVVNYKLKNAGAAEEEGYHSPFLTRLVSNGNGSYTQASFYDPATEIWDKATLEGAPIYQTHPDNGGKSAYFTTLAAGEEADCTAVYIVDNDSIAEAYLSFYNGIGAYDDDGNEISQPFVKVQE